MARRKRRNFTAEFKTETVKLIRESDRSVGEICRRLDLSGVSLHELRSEIDASCQDVERLLA